MTGKRLLIDVSSGVNQGAGIGRYARHLIGAAYPALASRYDVCLWYAADGTGEPPFARAFRSEIPREAAASLSRARFTRRRIDQLARLPISVRAEWLAGRFDACYSPDFTVPGATDRLTIVTVHDVAFEIVPEAYPPGLLRYLRTVVPINVHRARQVIVVSKSTWIDVVERYNVPEEKIRIIPNAAAERFFAAVPLEEQRRIELGIPDDYVLAVGTVEPRKNYLTLLEAQRLAYPATGRPLVVVGRSGWQNQAEMRLLAQMAARGEVVPLLNADDADLPGLYAGAHALAYVPHYEGFGLPVLEAMAAGTSVVASDIPALREIGSGMATLVEGSSVDSIASSLRQIKRATKADSLRLKEAARHYSWQESGTILVDTVATVMESGCSHGY
jgi:glycosyltransferase involved in cell wall biosynthesis